MTRHHDQDLTMAGKLSLCLTKYDSMKTNPLLN